MTTNQTIDGVPRELALRLLLGNGSELVRARKELRALLDQEVSGDSRAPQTQGEPVRLPARDESMGTAENDMYANGWRHGWNAYEHSVRQLGPLYAEQPAPVAVVMPERMTREQALGLSDYPPECAMYWWNACLDEVTRLNMGNQSSMATKKNDR